jgi:hypothetical protein
MNEVAPDVDAGSSGQRATKLLQSAATLDGDLRTRIAAVAEAERAGTEQFGDSRRVIAEAAAWVVFGLLVWLVAVLVWV